MADTATDAPAARIGAAAPTMPKSIERRERRSRRPKHGRLFGGNAGADGDEPMAQTADRSAGRKLTGKKCGQVFDVVADAKLVDIARQIEAANKLDRLGYALREAEISAAATADQLETVRDTQAEAELLAALAAANKAYATIQTRLEQLLATTEEVLRQLDRILASSG